MRDHRFIPFARKKRSTVSIPYLWCSRCLLVTVRNEATAKAIKKECADDCNAD